MKSIDRRLNKLERRFGIGRDAVRYIVSFTRRDPPLPVDECVKILDDVGFLPTCRARYLIRNIALLTSGWPGFSGSPDDQLVAALVNTPGAAGY